jgi:predicted RNA-binding protein with PUA-like domain
MQHWIMKSEPGEYSFDDLLKDGKTCWDGVRNYQARNNMKAMAIGDLVLIYHSISDKAVVGIATVSKTAYPDPASTDPKKDWVVVEIKPVKKLACPVTLETIKATASLAHIALVKQSRLSVIPVLPAEYEQLLQLAMG